MRRQTQKKKKTQKSLNKKNKPRRLLLVNKILLWINGLFVFALLLSYSASFIDPRLFWPIAFFGLAYPLLLFCNICFVGYWLCNRIPLALISLVTILIGWKFLTSYVGFRESTAIGVPKSSDSFLRVMTYNVHEFKQFGDKNDIRTKNLFLDIIGKEQPDIICFQEFFTRRRNEYDFKKAISEVLHSRYYYYKPVKGNNYESIGLAIFSKFPIIQTGDISFEKNNNNEAIFADIKTPKRNIRIYNVHLQSIRFKTEDYQYLDNIKSKMSTDMISPRRISERLKKAFLKRSEQVKIIKTHSEKCAIPYLVTGDFNDTPISYTVNKMLSGGLINSFRARGSGLGITYNGNFPNFQIDYILASTDFNVKSYRIISKKISDHYAVRSDLELK